MGDAGADGAGSRLSGLYCSLGQSFGSRDEQGPNPRPACPLCAKSRHMHRNKVAVLFDHFVGALGPRERPFAFSGLPKR